jgi:N-acyl-D-aspartate/D-glutamate deacylase
MFDLIFRNGTIVDGTGTPRFVGDVAIAGDRIAAVGPNLGPAHREVDATGKLITPGWVDMHTHYDGQITWDPQLTPSSWHGVTTVVMGNCGVGFAPVAPDKHQWLIGLMEGVEDIPGAALSEGIKWDWETFPEYLDAIEALPHAIDFGTQIPHGPLRGYVMGQRGADNEDATQDDIVQMHDLVAEALEAGALGFSTSRTLLHKSIDGVPVPGTFAGADELLGIGSALGKVGHGVFELAGEHVGLPQEMSWVRQLADQTGRNVVFNLSQIHQQPTLWKQMLGEVEKAHEDGLPVYAQCAGRAIGIIMNWRATAHPFALVPAAATLLQQPWDQALPGLRDPEIRRKILDAEPAQLGEFELFVTRTWSNMFPLRGADYEPHANESVAAIAARTGRPPAEVAWDILMEEDGNGSLYFPLFNYADGSLDPLHELHSHPLTRMGLSDAGAHCGAICDGGMPTFMLCFWTRDRSRGATLPLEHVVHRQTQQTAEFYGLFDRGVLKPGMKADVNLIDYDRLSIDRPKLVWDLPAGGRRLIQKATGYDMTVCSGVVISERGEPTGALPGKLIRGPQGAC